ncbi:MAG TPA: cobalamin biosynthesis protein CobQ [Ruminococcus sp.]|nr:cobalamin biosynthesis protein CobQ [Ruminococcus sp.]
MMRALYEDYRFDADGNGHSDFVLSMPPRLIFSVFCDIIMGKGCVWMYQPKKIIVVTGHFGSGKTNFSASLALALAAQGKKVTVVDFDLVNPYFRTADFAEAFAKRGITLRAPDYANTNVDIPSVQFDLGGLAAGEGHLIIDVGGDEDGAVALGRYSHVLNSYAETNELDMLGVVSFRRYLTRSAEDAEIYLRGIERASRMKLTHLVNNTNLGMETKPEMIAESMPLFEALCANMGLPAACVTVPDFIPVPDAVPDALAMQVPVVVRLPWMPKSEAVQ